MDDVRSTYGYAFSLSSCVFSWGSMKQQTMAQSFAEAEYVSAPLVTSQAIWLRRILEDGDKKQEEPTPNLYDKKSAIVRKFFCLP